MSKYNLKMVAKPATVKVKSKPQYDERGLLLNPTPDQLLDMLKKSEKDVKMGRLKEITCLEDLLNQKWD